MDFLLVVKTLFYDTGLNLVLGLIALDLVMGVSAALKTNTFDWGKLGQFYLTMVAPYVLTYAGLYAVDLFVPELWARSWMRPWSSLRSARSPRTCCPALAGIL